MSMLCQAVRGDGTLCENFSSNVRSTTRGPVAVCGHHVRSRTECWGRTFDPQDLWPEALQAAAEIYDQHMHRNLGSVEFYAEQATRCAAQAAECRLRAEWKRDALESNGNA